MLDQVDTGLMQTAISQEGDKSLLEGCILLYNGQHSWSRVPCFYYFVGERFMKRIEINQKCCIWCRMIYDCLTFSGGLLSVNIWRVFESTLECNIFYIFLVKMLFDNRYPIKIMMRLPVLAFCSDQFQGESNFFWKRLDTSPPPTPPQAPLHT